MYFYYITILLLFIPVFAEILFPKFTIKPSVKYILIAVSVSICIVVLGLRWETGTDWLQYIDHFHSPNVSEFTFNNTSRYEWGYNFLVSCFRTISSDYSFFLLVNASLFFFLIQKVYRFFTPWFYVALALFFVTFIGSWGANRQYLAVAFGLLSVFYVYEKKIWRYLVSVLIAFQFHTSAILLLFFFILRKKINSYIMLSAVLLCFVIGFTDLPFKIFTFFGSFSDYAELKVHQYLEIAAYKSRPIHILGFLKRASIFTFFFIFKEKITKLNPQFILVFNIYFLSFCFYLLFSQTMTVMIDRGSLYFNIFEPILISYVFYLLKDKKIIFLTSCVLLIYCFVAVNKSISSYPDLFNPYKGIFFNTEFHRNMH